MTGKSFVINLARKIPCNGNAKSDFPFIGSYKYADEHALQAQGSDDYLK